jgi:membrane-bound lytic murein transglycosylase D
MAGTQNWLPAGSKIPYKGVDFCELFKQLGLFSRLKPYFQQMTSTKYSIFLILLLSLVTRVTSGAENDLFPLPAELQPDVRFWTSVFTQYSTDEGVLHDKRNLAVVYEIMPMPATVGRRERNRRVQKRRTFFQGILRKLGSGKRDNLSVEERQVLALWQANVSNSELTAAAGRIRFQHGLSDRFREGLIRSGLWRAHVNAEFTRRGLPIDLAALPHVESSYNPAARSHVGASGIWQFTRSTGRRFLQVDHVLDERNDPFLATEAAAELLAYNYSITGNWPMAITAYNHGLSGARRAMRQFGDTEYTKILREYRGRTFGFASRNFYVAFLAAREVDQNPDKYFPGVTPEKPIDYQKHRLTAYLSSRTISDALGISERDLGQYNPALQATVFQGSKYLPKSFQIRVPNYRLSSPIGELIASIAMDEHFAEQLPDLFHTVARGDTLSEIATEYDTRVSTLVALNNLGSRHRIRVGQRIRLPAAGPAPEVVVRIAAEEGQEPPVVVAEMTAIVEPEPVEEPEEEPLDIGAMADDLAASVRSTIQSSLLSDPSDYTVDADQTIEVQPLETLGHFADWLEIKTQRLRDINGLAFRTPVVLGQRIKLDLSRVDAAAFERLRTEYHRQQQDAFFRTHTITGVQQHVVRRGESVWVLSLRQYDVPIWLFRQYNPALDLHTVQPGTRIDFPVLTGNSGI